MTSLRTVLLSGTALVVMTSLAAAPPARAGVDGGRVSVGWELSHVTASCTVSGETAPIAPVAFPGASGTASNAGTGSAVVTHDYDPGDSFDLLTSGSASVTAPVIGTGRAVITGRSAASGRATVALTDTQCRARVTSSAYASLDLDLARPMWVETSLSASGVGESRLVIIQNELSPAVEVATGRGRARVDGRLEAGVTYLTLGSEVAAGTTTGLPMSASQAGSFSIVLRPMGDASALTGNGRAFATLRARNCSSNRVAGALRSRVGRARRVTVAVNGRTVRIYRAGALRARGFAVPVASTTKASVVVRTVLRDGRVLRTRRAYLPCS